MGLSQFPFRIPKRLKDGIFSHLWRPSPLPALEMGSFISSRRLFSDTCIDSTLNSINNQVFGSRNEISVSLTNNRRSLSLFPDLHVGFCSASLVSEKIEFHVEAADEDSSCRSKRISENADMICRILATQPDYGISSSLDQSGVNISPELVDEVLKKLSNAGLLALSFFHWVEKQDGFKYTTQSFHHLIDALGKIKQFNLVWTLVDSMKEKGLLTKETFLLIARRYARARKVNEAVDTFEKMSNRKYGLKPDAADFNHLLDTLSKSKNVKKAQEIFNDMKWRNRFTPDLKSYTILLEGWGHNLDLPRLTEVYQEMLDEGFEPDVVTHGILINAFCKCRKIEEAVKIFHEMQIRNLKPSPHIYCSMINGLGSEKRLDEALMYFEQTKAQGFAPEIPTYNAVVGAYCWVHQFEDAYRILDEMKRCGVGPNARTYDVILHHLIKVRKTEEAYRIFQRMGRETDSEPELNTYTMIVRMFCAEERVDMALRVWKQMKEKGILPCMHMFSVLINGLCYENRLDDACSYFQEMLNMGIRPPGQLYSSLKQALLDGGKQDVAIDLGMKLDKLRKTPLSG